METKQLIEEILKHEELHDLITHLEDFKQAVELRLGMAELGANVGIVEFSTNVDYWERQLKTVNRLIEITKEKCDEE